MANGYSNFQQKKGQVTTLTMLPMNSFPHLENRKPYPSWQLTTSKKKLIKVSKRVAVSFEFKFRPPIEHGGYPPISHLIKHIIYIAYIAQVRAHRWRGKQKKVAQSTALPVDKKETVQSEGISWIITSIITVMQCAILK